MIPQKFPLGCVLSVHLCWSLFV